MITFFVDYNNDTWHYTLDDAVATVTFADGSEKDIFFYNGEAEITLPNGKEYDIYSHYFYDSNEDTILSLYIGGKDVKRYKCTVVKYDIIENGDLLVDDTKSEFRRFLNRLSDALGTATDFNTVSEIFENLFGSFFDTLINASDLFGGIFENIVSFIKFYLVG